MTKSGITRREFLRTSALASVSVGLVSCDGIGSIEGLSGGDLEFLHAVASGDPTASSVILWSRITPANLASTEHLRIGFEVAKDAKFKHLVQRGVVTTSAAQDFCIKVDALGLAPNSRYWYRFLTAVGHSPVGVTRTMPAQNTATRHLKMAVFSCANLPFGYFHGYAEAAKRSDDIDVALHLGDYLYEYPNGSYPSPKYAVRPHTPNGETLTLADYRQRYALYRTDQDLQAVHSKMPFICVWDDHEIANNAWRAGAENHTDDEGDFTLRLQAAVQAYREWMPIRPAQPLHQIYRSFEFGDLASLHMLDTRYIGRAKQLEYQNYVDQKSGNLRHKALHDDMHDASRSMLGDEQRSWLRKVVSQSRAKWQILGQQVLMGKYVLPSPISLRQISFSEFQVLAAYLELAAKQPDSPKIPAMLLQHPKLLSDQKKINMAKAAQPLPINLDAWDGYHREREHVFSLMSEPDSGFIALAGDTHNAWASYLRTDSNQVVGAEFGCQSISSPGLESFLQMNLEQAVATERDLIAAIKDLTYINAHDRGFMLVTVTAAMAEAEWVYVSDVRSKDYHLLENRSVRVAYSKQERTLQRLDTT